LSRLLFLPAVDRRKLGLRLIVKRFPKNAREAFLTFRHPRAVVLADHVFGIAEKLGYVPDRDARLLQKNARKGVAESGCRLFSPQAAKIPYLVQLSAKDRC
jgi:hypothetical protein